VTACASTPSCLRFITIGEATKQIPPSVTAHYPEIEWRKIAGLRDISVHSYYAVKPTILWDIIRTKLGPLEDAVEADDFGRRGAVELAMPCRACPYGLAGSAVRCW